MSRKSEALRGGQFVAMGADAICDVIDRHRAVRGGGEDFCSFAGATKLARRIEEFWGGKVACSVEPAGLFGYYAVRSTLAFAMPRRSP